MYGISVIMGAMKESRLEIRLSVEEHAKLKKEAKAHGYKTVSQYVRDRLRSSETSFNTAQEIARLRELTISTRRSIGSVCGNINQLARMYNTGQHPSRLLEWDRDNRERLLPLVYELIEQNRRIIFLCNSIMGRSK